MRIPPFRHFIFHCGQVKLLQFDYKTAESIYISYFPWYHNKNRKIAEDTTMKKKLCALLSALVLMSGCNTAEISETVSAEPPAEEPEPRYFLTTICPDGTEYLSFDNGESWEAGGAPSEKPPVYLTASAKNTYKPEDIVVINGHNLTGEHLSYGDSDIIYWFDGNEWIKNPYGWLFLQSLLVFWEDGHKVIGKFSLKGENAEYLLGQYRFEEIFEGSDGEYKCYFDFYIE